MTLMDNLKPVFEKTISVTDFVRNITKSFVDLKNGAKVIMKNNKPEAVIMSPGEYMQLINDLEDAQDLALAQSRSAKTNQTKLLSHDEFWNQVETSDDNDDEVEFESLDGKTKE